jgi:hypothetical protein
MDQISRLAYLGNLVKRAAINLAASSQFECLYTDNGRCADGGQELTAILV